MRKLTQMLGLVILAALLGVIPSAAAHDNGRGTVIYAFPAADVVFPEGIGYHAGNGDFFVGSTAGGAVYRGNVRGRSRTLTPFLPAGSDGRTAVLGMKVDPQGRLWLAGGATGTMWMYDAVTGRLLSEFKNGISGGFINDVAIGPDGAAYFTDSLVPLLYRIAPDTEGIFRYEVWRDFRDSAIQYIQGFNLNGIVVTPDGKYLIVIQTNTGKLFRIATDTKEISEIKLTGGDLMTFGDGLLLDGQTLYVARNNLNLIVQLRLTADYSGGQQIGSFTDPSFGVTTTVARAGDRLLVVNAQFNRRNNPALPFTISSVRIP